MRRPQQRAKLARVSRPLSRKESKRRDLDALADLLARTTLHLLLEATERDAAPVQA